MIFEKKAPFPAPSKEERRSTRCCIMSNLTFGLKRPEDEIKVDLENAILDSIKNSRTTFIVCISTIIDIWAAKIILRLKSGNPDIKLIITPGIEQFTDDSFDFVVSHADYLFHADNKKVLNSVSSVIAVYNGKAIDPIRYARNCHTPVKYIGA